MGKTPAFARYRASRERAFGGRRSIPNAAALAAWLLVARPAVAADEAPVPASSDPEQKKEEGSIEVVVHGPTAGGFVSRVSSDETPREPIDAASMLAELPSVHVRRLGADGSFGTLSVRGSASTQVAVVLAGVPLTSGADPSADVGSLPLWPGATFRVHRGFAPAAVGATGYLGGVLAIDPPSAPAGSRTEWWAAAGSFGSLKLRAGDVRKAGPTTWSTGLSASRSDGDFTYELLDPRTRRLRERTRTNAGHVAVSGIERATMSGPWGSAGAMVFADARKQGLAGTALRPTTGARLDSARLLAAVDGRLKTSEAAAVHGALWGRRETSSFADPLGELSVGRPAASGKDAIEAAGGSLGWRGRPVDPLSADVFADARAERFLPSESRLASPGTRASRLAAGVGADLVWRAVDRLSVAASARVDARHDDGGGALALDGSTLGASSDVAPSGHAGASLRVADALTLAAHAGFLERPPSFVELYGDRGALLGDPALRPERALSADAGATGDLAWGSVHLGYELTGFVTAATDLITFEELGDGTLVARNVAGATIAGAEASLVLASRVARTSLSYTWLHTENTGDAPLAQGRPLPGRPVHDLAYDASYRAGPVRLRYSLDAVAGTTTDTAGRIVLPARFLHGGGASLEVPHAEGLTLGVQVDNLFDLRTLHVRSSLGSAPIPVPVSDFLDFPLPGRTVWVTARFAYEAAPAGEITR